MARVNKYIVIGYKRIDYKKSNGKEVHGCEVYLQAYQPDEGVEGVQAEAVYISDSFSTLVPEIGLIVRKSFNQWGRVEDLTPCEVPQ